MKNHVSPKTASDLKAADFPQPEPAPGQFWYTPDFGLFVVGPRLIGDERLVRIFYLHTGKAYAKDEANFSECIYAPDVADILAEMPDTPLRYSKKYKAFVCGAYEHENPAEAAALAYIELKKQ